MRILVAFFVPGKILLPWDYLNWLRGRFYQAMAWGRPKLARDMHDEGFSSSGKRYKLATFSLLYPERYELTPQGIQTWGRLRWWISSPLEPLLEAIALGLLARPEVRLGASTLYVEQIGVVVPPTFSEAMTLVTLSLIFVSTGERDAEGRFHQRFLSPEEPDFARVLTDNLKRKSAAIYGETLESELPFEWLDEPRSKLMMVNDIKVRGWMMCFRVSGAVDLIRLGYEAGFGERNAQGFGMVCLPEEHPTFSRREV